MSMDLLRELSLEAESKTAVNSEVSASKKLLQQRQEQKERENKEQGIVPVFDLKLPTLSDYHAQIAASVVPEPRRQSILGKHKRKVEKGSNYKDKLLTKFGKKTQHTELIKKLKNN